MVNYSIPADTPPQGAAPTPMPVERRDLSSMALQQAAIAGTPQEGAPAPPATMPTPRPFGNPNQRPPDPPTPRDSEMMRRGVDPQPYYDSSKPITESQKESIQGLIAKDERRTEQLFDASVRSIEAATTQSNNFREVAVGGQVNMASAQQKFGHIVRTQIGLVLAKDASMPPDATGQGPTLVAATRSGAAIAGADVSAPKHFYHNGQKVVVERKCEGDMEAVKYLVRNLSNGCFELVDECKLRKFKEGDLVMAAAGEGYEPFEGIVIGVTDGAEPYLVMRRLDKMEGNLAEDQLNEPTFRFEEGIQVLYSASQGDDQKDIVRVFVQSVDRSGNPADEGAYKITPVDGGEVPASCSELYLSLPHATQD